MSTEDGKWDLGESGYKRRKIIEFAPLGYCDVCKKDNIDVLYFDTSDGEYGGIQICLACFTALLKSKTGGAQNNHELP